MRNKMQWWPIETAPKDGSLFIVGWAGEPEYAMAKYDSDRSVYSVTFHTLVDEEALEVPTHWMPLPEPPENKKEEEKSS